MGQMAVTCKHCSKRFLVPSVDTSRQEISEIDPKSQFGLICPFCLTHAVYFGSDLR